VKAAPESLRELKLLDPACGSGHFLVIAFELLAALYREEARHRGQAWSDEQIAAWIVEHNLHGIDIDARAIQIAAAAEHLHSATLVHDDVVDGASLRRGRASANAQFGPRLSILVGDFLYAVCCQTLVDDGSPDILSIFSESIRSMAEGEVLQLSQSFDPDITESMYREVIERKTGTLIASCSEAGAILGGVTRAERRALRGYGKELGLAFQLVDDALDYGGNAKDLGKNTGDDFREGKVTLPVILAYRRGTVAEREFWKRSIEDGAAGDAELEKATNLMTRYGAIADTIGRARHFGDIARDALAPMKATQQKHALLEVIDFCISRVA
jgi:octaprenyl-diphosphate synthase